MTPFTVIQGVDETVRNLTVGAVALLDPKPEVTVGPLDREDNSLHLNWFLYRISPSEAYRNMEPPRTGWRTSRGRPPLALRLQYLLSAFPAAATLGGDQEQFSHASLAAAMQALHANAIIDEDDVLLSGFAKPLVEPLRITMETLDLEALSKLWTATTQPMRLSVGYEVSLVVIDSTTRHAAGPPVLERRVGITPSMGPRLHSVDPPRVSFGEDFLVAATGLTSGVAFTLAPEDGDDPPAPAEGWPMTPVATPPPPLGSVALTLPNAALTPGPRRLDVTASEAGLPTGRDSIGVTVVPKVLGPTTPLDKGVPVALQTAHAAPDVEVFLRGVRLAPASVDQQSATQVTITIAPGEPGGDAAIMLRAGKVAGPVVHVEIAP